MRNGNPIWHATGLLLAVVITSGIWIETLSIADDRTSVQLSGSAVASPSAIVPEGWRRTRNGWEHTSTWHNLFAHASINELIQLQRQREPAWIRFGFAKLRSIPPLMIAVLQISAIAMIINIAQHRRKQQAG